MNILNRNDIVPLKTVEHETQTAETVDLGRVIQIIWAGKWTIAACLVVTMLVALYALRQVTPQYFAAATVLLDDRQKNVTNVRAVVADLSLSASVVAGEVSVIRSNLLLGKVVDQLDLVDDPDWDPRIERPKGAVDRIVETLRGWMLSAKTNLGLAEPAAPLPEKAPDPRDPRDLVIGMLQQRLSVNREGISHVLNIGFTDPDPQTAARFANAIAKRYIQDQIDQKRQTTEDGSVWLNERIARLKDSVERTEADVVAFKASQALTVGSEDTINQQLAQLNQELTRARGARVMAEARYDQVHELLESGGMPAAASALTSPLILTLSQQKAELQRRQAELGKKYGREHPDQVAVAAELEDIDRAFDVEVGKAVAALKSDVAVELARERELDAAIKEHEERLVEISRNSVRLRQLERSADATRAIYEMFLNRYMETTQQAELQQADARIISVANAPFSPAYPRSKLVLAAAGGFGLSIGIALVFALALTANRVETPHEVRTRLRLPVLAALPNVSRVRGRGWILRQLSRRSLTPFAEAVRALRAALNLEQLGGESLVLMVCSAETGQGKTTTSTSLASVMQVIGRHVVMVECDVRRPVFWEVFGNRANRTARVPCLADYLKGTVEPDQVIQHHKPTGIDYIPAAVHPMGGADLFSTPRFQILLDHLADIYDVVILDTPPLVEASDARVVARYADVALLVVASGQESLPMVERALRILADSDVRVAGVVLNRAKRAVLSGGSVGA
ncbi:polysaccharide biosynthesis tyrosine autokinase [Acuticoccus sp. M5D2P5]|uniref:GumC family protein n=1 Tax=Acuticoccus kalidii TaxID=2910977 RepID=UPI001F36D09B|nr:Wzz/FepE/Etk N-terminal domain-containing protein [Acuticoccus kalidii]MCF3935166.1 polysaccharide biosynthesis tyrosine autokinase [Acuticoccus kalidii]